MDYSVLCGEARFLVKGVVRITRKGWLFNHEIAFWGEGELPLAIFRDHDVSALIAEHEDVVWKHCPAREA